LHAIVVVVVVVVLESSTTTLERPAVHDAALVVGVAKPWAPPSGEESPTRREERAAIIGRRCIMVLSYV
jgi:hypothetical protein